MKTKKRTDTISKIKKGTVCFEFALCLRYFTTKTLENNKQQVTTASDSLQINKVNEEMRYIDLAEMSIADISSGKLVKNSRMPSLRKFKQQHLISMTTALNCYQYLESLGWILAKPQSGYFVCGQRTVIEKPELVAFKSIMTKPKLPAIKPYYRDNNTSASTVDSAHPFPGNHSAVHSVSKEIVGPL
jgi:DNA-binding transcriptional regulator YhcF (GntR family)